MGNDICETQNLTEDAGAAVVSDQLVTHHNRQPVYHTRVFSDHNAVLDADHSDG